MRDNKRDYLIKTLSRTKRKDYENYIINGVFQRLNRLDLKPVTQQYVLRSDGKRALIDLYFPQLNYGVECDEEYHLGNQENDLIREITMEEMLSAIKETEDFILQRIPAYESIESIDKRINEIVEEINELTKERKINPWVYDEDFIGIALRKGMISVDDNFFFERIVDICKCFGRDYKGMQQSYFNIGNGYHIWCPKLSVKSSFGPKSVAKGWINILSDDWEYIHESNENLEKLIVAGNEKRITFAKSKDVLGRNVYRFIGVFSYSQKLSKNDKIVYKRVAKEIALSQWKK